METFEIAATAGFLSFISGVTGTILTFIIRSKTSTRIENQQLNVTLAKEFVTRQEYREDINELFKELKEQHREFSDIRAGMSQQLGSIEGTLKAIQMLVAERNSK